MFKLNKVQWLFWGTIFCFLLLHGQQLLTDPTVASGFDASPVIITEVVADNISGLVDEDGDPEDWIELYNRSPQTVNLLGWTLTDDAAVPDKWRFPEIMLPGGAYLVVFASGKDRFAGPDQKGRQGDQIEAGAQPFLHTNFKLNADGSFLALYAPTLRRYLDAAPLTLPPQFSDISFGRLDPQAKGELVAYAYFDHPTPGALNDVTTAQAEFADPVAFSVLHGLYTAPFPVTLTSPAGDAQIRYTTNGSEPSVSNGLLYSGPIPITTTTVLRAVAFAPNQRPSPSVAHSYLFPDAVLTQPATPPSFPMTWGTHQISFAGHQAGNPVQADYGMDARIAQDPDYQPLLRQGLQALPTLSLAMAVEDFTALYDDPQARGPETERPASVEYIPATQNEPGFQINAGLRIQGGAGRWEYMPKHSFRIFFKRTYGAGKLNYPLFAGSPVSKFDTLVLRAGVDRSFAGHPDTPDHHLTTYTRDEWARASQIAMSGVGSHGLFVHLYINGLYWGLYNVVERPDASFAAAYYGGVREEWGSVNHSGPVSGLIDRFAVLQQLAQEGGLADPTRYATMLEFIDPIQFSDYLILNWYAGNTDWPENNWYANVQYPAGRNLFFTWDAEKTWDHGAEIYLGGDGVTGAPFPNVIKQVFMALLENPEFRLLFADRLYAQVSQGGALSDQAAQTRWQTITEPLNTAIVAESARWGDVRYPEPITREDWLRASALVLQQMQGNGARLVTLARAAGYYPAIDPPTFDPPATEFQTEEQVTIASPITASPVGEIYYTTDGSDPRQPGTGEIAPTAQRYTQPLLITDATIVKARVFLRDSTARDQWSALHEGIYRRPGQQGEMRITELMYHAPEGNEYEYLELKNVGELPVDLSRAYFTGIIFHFLPHTSLAPGKLIVLVRDFRKFRAKYPTAEIFGVYEGDLNNGGETITLHAGDGRVLFSVQYKDRDGWPISPDGRGDSLVLTQPDGNPNEPWRWRASEQIGGSPGEDEKMTR